MCGRGRRLEGSISGAIGVVVLLSVQVGKKFRGVFEYVHKEEKNGGTI